MLTFSKAARLFGESEPGVVKNLLHRITVYLEVRQTAACWIVCLDVASQPVQVTAHPPGYKLQQTPGEAVALLLLARSGWSVENSPLHEVKVSVHPSFGLEINTLSLTQPRHVHPGPELASLVQEDLVAVREVIVTVAICLS